LSSMDIVFTGNSLTGGQAGALGNSVLVSDSASSHLTFDFNGNTLTRSVVNAYTFFQSATTTASASMIGKFRNNIIGTTGVLASGSAQGDGLTINPTGLGKVTVNVTGNTIRQYGNFGVQVLAGDTSPKVNVTMTGNTIKEPIAATALQGIKAEIGTTSASAPAACLDIGGAGALANNVNGSGNGVSDIRVRQLFSSTVQMPGVGADPVAYLVGRNITSPTATAVGTFSNTPGGAACEQAP